ncbi:prenyltransferase [Thermodesulfobacteriota bacterium]
MQLVSYWLREIRAPFLSLSVVLVFLGSSVAAAEGTFYFWRAVLAVVGLVALHISVNLLNEYSDYRTGIDFDTSQTPFSGGSGVLIDGKISPRSALVVGITCFGVGLAIGILFLWLTNIRFLPLMLVGGASVVLYTDFLARHSLGEIFAGLGLGLLPVLGAYFIHAGHYSTAAMGVAVPAGILTFNLLLINEFPDVEADRKGGRRNLILTLGSDTAGRIYTILMLAMYVWIAVAIGAGLIPFYCVAAILTVPVALKPMRWAWTGVKDRETMVPALGANVLTNLATQTLLGAGFLASKYL